MFPNPLNRPITWDQVLHHTKAEIDAFGKKDDEDWVNETVEAMETSLTDADVLRFMGETKFDARIEIQRRICVWLGDQGYAVPAGKMEKE